MVSVSPQIRATRRVSRCVRAVIGPTQGNIIFSLQTSMVIHRFGELIGKHPRKVCGGLALSPVFTLPAKNHQAGTCQLTSAAVPISPRCILMSTGGPGILQRRAILCDCQPNPCTCFFSK